MEEAKVVSGYALGGAVAASVYLETISTLDVDIFVNLPLSESQWLISLDPIFGYFKSQGYEVKEEYLMIAGWPVQFLPAPGPLEEEALENAITRAIEGVSIRIFSPEYLAAIALKTNRPKDKARLLQFMEAKILDLEVFHAILRRHHLGATWTKFQTQFLQ